MSDEKREKCDGPSIPAVELSSIYDRIEAALDPLPAPVNVDQLAALTGDGSASAPFVRDKAIKLTFRGKVRAVVDGVPVAEPRWSLPLGVMFELHPDHRLRKARVRMRKAESEADVLREFARGVAGLVGGDVDDLMGLLGLVHARVEGGVR